MYMIYGDTVEFKSFWPLFYLQQKEYTRLLSVSLHDTPAADKMYRSQSIGLWQSRVHTREASFPLQRHSMIVTRKSYRYERGCCQSDSVKTFKLKLVGSKKALLF